ncbi:MAG: T9SS type A sorting domain-containing protein [Bacteroidia bacterium]
MKKLFLLLVSFHLLFIRGFSQNIQWQNTIGGGNHDGLNSISQTSDGGYICGGGSISNISGDKTENCLGQHDYWVVKIDISGNIQWQNTIGGSGYDVITSISQTSDGGYICGGRSNSNISVDKTENCLGGFDYWVIKLDMLGDIQWQNTIGGGGFDYLSAIIQTSDDGYICGGYSGSNISGDKTENNSGYDDYWVIKLDSLGNIQWQNTIGGDSWEVLTSISLTIDGGYVCGGFSGSDISGDKTENCLGDFDYWVVKLDMFGSIQWQNTIGGGGADYLYSIKQTNDGGYILGGYSHSGISGDKTENNRDTTLATPDYWVIKLDSTGNIQWQKTIGGGNTDQLYSISETIDGKYICGGYSTSNISGDKTENCLGGHDYWIIKLDANANIQWQNTIGGDTTDWATSVGITSDGGYIIGGHSTSNVSGDKTENSNGGSDYWIVKINDTTITTTTQTTIQNPQSAITIFPSPANKYSVISYQFAVGDEIRITDVLGKILFTKTITRKCSMFNVQCSMLTSGMYFVTVSGEKGRITQKIVVSH